jgi:hypothetical protein
MNPLATALSVPNAIAPKRQKLQEAASRHAADLLAHRTRVTINVDLLRHGCRDIWQRQQERGPRAEDGAPEPTAESQPREP